MDRAELQDRQRPLKDRYREDPDAAMVTLSAAGTVGAGVSCSLSSGRAMAEAGLHPATGGDGTQLCSGDMLLEALVACAGVTLRSVATSLEIPVRSGTVTDARSTDAFGLVVTSSGSTPTPFGFAGSHGYQQDSETGLMRLGHRMYDAATGRFISRDPIQDGQAF